VHSFSNSGDAYQLSGELQSHGFGAYVVQEQSGSGIKFSVKVGQFSNFTDARNASAILSQQWNRPARVVMIEATVGH
jgi:cell division septation protein DedD